MSNGNPTTKLQPKKSSDSSFDIAIVGGGITGLILTLCLQRKAPHIPITLYEAAPKFGEIGAGVSFGPNAQQAMTLIDEGIRKGFDKIATNNQWQSKKNSWFDFRVGDGRWTGKGLEEALKAGGKQNLGITDGNASEKGADGVKALKSGGETWFHQLKSSNGQNSVHRAHFLDEMVHLLKGDVAQFGKRLVDARHLGNGSIKLQFKDGTENVHGAVIGCDGIKSRSREIVLGEDHEAARAVFSGKYAYRGLIPMDKAVELVGEELARNSQMYCGYGGHVLTFAIEKGATMNGECHVITQFSRIVSN
jgi:salicylate hydroxylase